MFEDVLDARVRPLAEALVKNGCEQLRIVDGEVEIELRRSPHYGTVGQAEQAGEAAAEHAAYDVVTAEVVGRVRFLRPPTAVGMLLDGDREIASIEALGIRNPIRSRGPGRIAVVFVEEGQAVDYGAPLFAIDRAT